MLTNLCAITPDAVAQYVATMPHEGYRFVTITCVDLGGELDLIYHFDRGYELTNLRMRLPRGTPLQSISGVYFAAAIVENEIKDLFGVPVEGLAIDYQGHLLLAEGAPESPMSKKVDAPAKTD